MGNDRALHTAQHRTSNSRFGPLEARAALVEPKDRRGGPPAGGAGDVCAGARVTAWERERVSQTARPGVDVRVVGRAQ